MTRKSRVREICCTIKVERTGKGSNREKEKERGQM
jgi:hypothetical protein